MKHFPAHKHPAHIAGIEHSQAPVTCSRLTAWLVAAVLFASGFFSGAILFGAALVAQHHP